MDTAYSNSVLSFPIISAPDNTLAADTAQGPAPFHTIVFKSPHGDPICAVLDPGAMTTPIMGENGSSDKVVGYECVTRITLPHLPPQGDVAIPVKILFDAEGRLMSVCEQTSEIEI